MEVVTVADVHAMDEGVVEGVNVQEPGRKRKRVSSTEGANYLADYRLKMDNVFDYVGSLGNKLSKKDTETMISKLRDMENVFLDLMMDFENVKGRLTEQEKLRELIDNYESRDSGKTDWATVVKKGKGDATTDVQPTGQPIVNRREPVRNTNYAVVVRGSGAEPLTADKIKTKLLTDVRKVVGDVRISAVRRVRNGVAIEATNSADIMKLKECAKFRDLGLKVEEPRKVGPKIIIYGVPDYLSTDEFMGDIYSKNAKGLISETEWKERVRIISKNKGALILEVPLKVKELFLKSGKVYIGWSGCNVREVDVVQRCFRCYGYGHMARDCKLKEDACRKCGDTGHRADACPGYEVCRNCIMDKRMDAQHSVLSRECPLYLDAVQRARGRVTQD